MSFFVQSSSAGIERIAAWPSGAGDYRATTEDPQFTYRFWLRRPRYMVVMLQADEVIDPKIYLDRGNGFNEAGTIMLDHQAGSCIYRIKITSPHQVRRLRIDPCSTEARFRYWAKSARSEEELANLFDEAIAEASRENCVGPHAIYDVLVDGKSEKRTWRKLNKNAADHFAAIVALARRTAPEVDQSLIKDGPFISFVVPVFNTPERYLNELLGSFREQPTGAAELILCDDGSTSSATASWLDRHGNALDVRIIRNGRNCGIAAATNSGLGMARGTWVGLIDHDDALTPCAVQLIAQTIRDHPTCQFIYTDEVVTDEMLKPINYHLKPAYDEVLLSGVNYINHFSCYRRDRLLALGGLRTGYDGSQDYDLLLRYLRDLKPKDVKHLPYPAYRWRRGRNTFSAQFLEQATQAARRALAERYRKVTNEGPPIVVDEAITKTLHRVRFDKARVEWPHVSIVIPSRDAFPLISRILADLVSLTAYPNFEIIIIDNGSADQRVHSLYAQYQRGPVPFRCEVAPAPFNFSRQVNRGIALAQGELVLLLNNDIEVINSDWLQEMVSCFAYPNTGIVGARLLYPSRRIQHAGVIVGLGGLAGHWFDGQREGYPGPMARLHVRQSLTAVTGACMLMSRSCLEATGPFDEIDFAIAYNDVDFCLRAVKRGFRVIWTPFATLIHHQSATRGSDGSKENRDRFREDKEHLRRRHHTETADDLAYSPWYSRSGSQPTVLELSYLPKSR